MLTITCLHCGPVRVEDAAEVRYITGHQRRIDEVERPRTERQPPRVCAHARRAAAVMGEHGGGPVETHDLGGTGREQPLCVSPGPGTRV